MTGLFSVFEVMEPQGNFTEKPYDPACNIRVTGVVLQVLLDSANPTEKGSLVNSLLKEIDLFQISLSLSSSLLSEAKTEKYKDLRALLQLLSSLCSKDLVDFSSDSIETQGTNISQVVCFGLHIVTPLVSLDLLKYPKPCHDYFSLLSHLLEVYPETVAQLNGEAFTHVLGTLDFGLHYQDTEVVDMCLRALKALASYHYTETVCGKTGLGLHISGLKDPGGNLQEGILSRFLHSLLQLLLFEDYSPDLVSSAADALLPLILCEQGLYQLEQFKRQLMLSLNDDNSSLAETVDIRTCGKATW
ncbi:uncharacterized protein LOC132169608 [Corylus avellana]|uniref:uncharacterized protein LOC132169608 n=1 Tax=Corylus avellana TaxID=13451 RepID=UPI00286C78DF|nr:uncharacterized protein LOC132169608 [Corylus avellana]